jgi:hypothetical protein
MSKWAGKVIPPRQRRRMQRLVIAENEVPCRGDALGEIWWRAAQWAVTADGLERLDGCYFIDKKRLLENREYPWPLHMAGKPWVDADEFTTAWMIALVLHGYGVMIEPAKLRELFALLPPWRVGGWKSPGAG